MVARRRLFSGRLTRRRRSAPQRGILARDISHGTRGSGRSTPVEEQAWLRYRATPAYGLAIWLSTLGTTAGSGRKSRWHWRSATLLPSSNWKASVPSQVFDMQPITDLSLPHLAIEDSNFAEDPFARFTAARQQHPWLARSSFGYVITEYAAIKDLLGMDDKLRVAQEGVIDLHERPRLQAGQVSAWIDQRHRGRTAQAPSRRARADVHSACGKSTSRSHAAGDFPPIGRMGAQRQVRLRGVRLTFPSPSSAE